MIKLLNSKEKFPEIITMTIKLKKKIAVIVLNIKQLTTINDKSFMHDVQ